MHSVADGFKVRKLGGLQDIWLGEAYWESCKNHSTLPPSVLYKKENLKSLNIARKAYQEHKTHPAHSEGEEK